MNKSTIPKLSHIWSKIAITALGLSGLYSIILVFLRAPLIKDLVQDKEIFKVALVVHVDLSVLVWFLSGAAIIWMYNIYSTHYTETLTTRYNMVIMSVKILALIAILGIGMMALSPLTSYHSSVSMNNYIPMFDNILFTSGISLFSTSILILALISISRLPRTHDQYAGFIGALIFLISVCCFVMSYWKIMREISYPLDLHGFYEMLFWSGGHSMQFLYLHIMYFAWIFALDTKHKFPAIQLITMWTNLVVVIPLIPMHFMYNIDSPEFIRFFTIHMKYAGAVSSLFMIGSIFVETFYAERNSKWLLGIALSVLLFISGGLIGLIISEINVTIPAHYHGSVVSVTIAMMVMIYHMMNFEAQEVKIANTQLLTYTIGQALHIAGLALSGGYGVLRKNPEMMLSIQAKITMGIMGLGGLIAIIGGLMFVMLIVRKMYFSYAK
ncbi:MAG: hypothetical protein RLZZ59_375 [Pseudomonadota bacterium]|jgi:hypothetical protein